MLGNRPCLIEEGLIVKVRFSSVVASILQVSFWFAWHSDIRILGFDEDRSSRRLHCLTEGSGEPLVPTPPKCRRVGNRFQIKVLMYFWRGFEVFDKGRFVGPPVEFFQQE
ncbi:hypothetical protein GCM10027355_26280 [Haloplanus salinarum]